MATEKTNRQVLIHLHSDSSIDPVALLNQGEIAVKHASNETALYTLKKGGEATAKFLPFDATKTAIQGATTTTVKAVEDIVSTHTTKLTTIQGDGAGSINKALEDANTYTNTKVGEVSKKVHTITTHSSEDKHVTLTVTNGDNPTVTISTDNDIASKATVSTIREELDKAKTDIDNLELGNGAVKSFAGKDGDILIDSTDGNNGHVKFTVGEDKTLKAEVKGIKASAFHDEGHYATASKLGEANGKISANDEAIKAEVTRAKEAEKTLTTNLANEVTRAKKAEGTLTTNLANAVETIGENTGNITANKEAISAETDRATTAETNLGERIDGHDTKIGTLEKTIKSLEGTTHFIGVTTTVISDGEGPQTVSIKQSEGPAKSVQAKSGDIVIYEDGEFIWDGSVWRLLGDTTAQDEKISTLTSTVERHTTDISNINTKITNIENGTNAVISVGGQKGAITVDTAQATNGKVNFAMSGKMITASVVGINTAAYKEEKYFATADALSGVKTTADAAVKDGQVTGRGNDGNGQKLTAHGITLEKDSAQKLVLNVNHMVIDCGTY